MSFCRLCDEYWAVNLESLGLDTSANTETSRPCNISKHGLVAHKFNIDCHKLLSGPPLWTRARGHGLNISHLKVSFEGRCFLTLE